MSIIIIFSYITSRGAHFARPLLHPIWFIASPARRNKIIERNDRGGYETLFLV